MQKRILFLLVFLLCFQFIIAQSIDESTAQNVAQTFFSGQTNTAGRTATFELAYKASSKEVTTNTRTENKGAYFYVFNSETENGFVIVSGDERAQPILAYSDEGTFNADHIPTNLAKWLEGYENELRQIFTDNVKGSSKFLEQWKSLKEGRVIKNTSARSKAVSPLIQTKWNQSPFYNDLAPNNSVTGCVATAMAQVMKYWEHPAKGMGFHSYNHEVYGTLSANFGATTYDWNAMPNEVNSTNFAVATLMYHCGVSVDMNYSPESSGAYGAPVVEPALREYFGYPDATMKERADFTSTAWMELLKTELDAGRPMYYEGTGNGSGHAFVCDGYDVNNFFHFNWGWGGFSDGYYSLQALEPVDLGTGAGSGSYNSNQKIVIGIEPPAGQVTVDLSLNNYLTADYTEIAFGQELLISTNILNTGNGTFTGDYAAAVFDNASNFVGFIETKTNQTLQKGFTYNEDLVFYNEGLLSMLPGTYTVSIFFRPTDGEWIQVSDQGNFVNSIEINVVNINSISLNSDITITEGADLIQGQPLSVNLNIVNNGTEIFIGQYDVSLYYLDGTLAQTIGTVDEPEGLPAGYTYLDPYLTFSTTEITVEPGTYFLAVLHYTETNGYELTGSTGFQNPITVTVSAPAIAMDTYEDNDEVGKAFNLPVTFTTNTVNKKTPGANCHTGSDYDFYKIILPAEGEYEITARIHDAYNAGDNETYTLDGLVSFSTDRENWSDAYDDIISEEIKLAGGQTIYFQVAPYFAGENGTYQLDITLKELVVTESEPFIDRLIKVYPNPASESIFIDGSVIPSTTLTVHLSDIRGRKVFTATEANSKPMQVPVTHLPEGFYLLQLQAGKASLTKKIIIKK